MSSSLLFYTDSPRPYFYEYFTTAKGVSVSRGASEGPKKYAACRAQSSLRPPNEFADIVDSGWVCGGHRDCGAMPGVAEVVGGGCGARNSRGRDSGRGIFAWRHAVLVAWICALLAWVAIGGVAVSVARAAIPANHIARFIAAGRVTLVLRCVRGGDCAKIH